VNNSRIDIKSTESDSLMKNILPIYLKKCLIFDNVTQLIPRHIFIFWGQGFANAPEIIHQCVISWYLKNPTWKVLLLDWDNLNEYLSESFN
jgi:hypothetical protein